MNILIDEDEEMKTSKNIDEASHNMPEEETELESTLRASVREGRIGKINVDPSFYAILKLTSRFRLFPYI